jgi:hypothetical protein
MKKTLAIATVALCAAGPAGAVQEIVDFNQFSSPLQSDTIVVGSYVFTAYPTGSMSVQTSAPDYGDFNGTPYLQGLERITVQRIDHAAFSVDSLQVSLGEGGQGQSFANLSTQYWPVHCGGPCAYRLDYAVSPTFETLTPGQTAWRLDLDMPYPEHGFFSYDNFAFSVPEPAAPALLLAGLAALGMGAAGRRRAQASIKAQ